MLESAKPFYQMLFTCGSNGLMLLVVLELCLASCLKDSTVMPKVGFVSLGCPKNLV
jgi:hypothetical protein